MGHSCLRIVATQHLFSDARRGILYRFSNYQTVGSSEIG